MADTKQTSQLPNGKEAAKSAQAQSALRERLLEEAKKKIAQTDVGGDRKADEKETKAKEEALQFIRTECLGLPEDRFEKLLEAVILRMKQKEAYKRNLLEEYRKARADIAQEVERTKSPAAAPASKTAVPAKPSAAPAAKPEPKPLAMDRGANIQLYDKEILTDRFDPAKTDLSRAMPLLESLDKYPQSEGALLNAIRGDDGILAGFLIHWRLSHPAYQKLKADGRVTAIAVMDRIEGKLRGEFGIPRNPLANGASEKEYAKMLTERIGKWKRGEYNQFLNRTFDVANFDRKLFKRGFASRPEGMSESDYTTYVTRSANYLEYVANRGNDGLNELLRQLKEHPEAVVGIAKEWKPGHQVRRVLEIRGKTDVIAWVDKFRSETLRRYGISADAAEKLDVSTLRTVAETNAFGTGSWDRSRNYAYEKAFDPKEPMDVTLNARYLNYASLPGNEKEWAAFAEGLRNRPKAAALFVMNWKPDSTLARELEKNGGAETVRKLSALKASVKRDFALPESLKNAQEAEQYFVKFAEIGRGKQELGAEIEQESKAAAAQIKQAFKEIKHAVREGDAKQLEAVKSRLAQLQNSKLVPLRIRAEKILPDIVEADRSVREDPMRKKINSTIAAVEVLRSITTWKEDDTFKGVKRLVDNFLNGPEAMLEAKGKQLEAALEGNPLTVTAFNAEGVFGTDKKHRVVDMETVDQEIRNRRIEQVNSQQFRETLVQTHAVGRLTKEDLRRRWGGSKLTQIALNWGVDADGGFDAAKVCAASFDKLQKERPEVAQAFLKILGNHMRDEGEKTRILETASASNEEVRKFFGKFGVPEKEIGAKLAKLKSMDPVKRWDEISRLGGNGKSPGVAEIEAFFTALGKGGRADVAISAREAKADVLGSATVAQAISSGKIEAAIELAIKEGRTGKEGKEALAFLKNPELRVIAKNPAIEGTPRERKVSELSPEHKKTLLLILKKFAPNSEYVGYLSKFEGMVAKLTEAKVNGTIGANGKIVAVALAGMGTPKGNKKIDTLNQAIVSVAQAGANIQIEGMFSTKGQEISSGTRKMAEKAVAQAEAMKRDYGIRLAAPKGSADPLRKTEGEKSSAIENSDEEILRAVASGKIRNTAELVRAIERAEAGERPFKNSETPLSKAGLRTVGEAEEKDVGRTGGFHESIRSAEPGQPIAIGSGMIGSVTESGGIEIRTASGKLRFDAVEAEGAIQLVERLQEMDAEFLIPAMKEIAGASETMMKDGVGREETRRIVRSLAYAFGYDGIAEEKDPRVLLAKFRTAASGAMGGGNIRERARKFGIVDENGNLKTERLRYALEAEIAEHSGTAVKEA